MHNQIIQTFSIPLLLFSISVCVTPGPNNIMLAASGANFGYRRTLPHIIGVLTGMNLLFACAATGLAPLFLALPMLQWTLKIGGALFLLYFAFKIGASRPVAPETEDGNEKKREPLSFVSAGLFQFLNPKGLMIGLSTLSLFSVPGENYIFSVAAVMLTFTVVCTFTASLWAGVGAALQNKMKNARFFRGVNIILALLTIGTIAILFI